MALSLAVATSLFAQDLLPLARASETAAQPLPGFVIAQTSMGSPDPIPPQAPSLPAPTSPPPGPAPAPAAPSASTDVPWGAIGFTADGSYSTNWKMPSQAEAEAKAAKGCAQFGRGSCQVVSFSGQECVGLATFIGPYRRRRWNLSFTAGGMTYPEAQSAAIGRCNADERSQGRCQPRTAACADGR